MNTAQPTVWTGTVSDEQQAKVPWVVGVRSSWVYSYGWDHTWA